MGIVLSCCCGPWWSNRQRYFHRSPARSEAPGVLFQIQKWPLAEFIM